jgi:phosphotransferase system HPr-like phosphotransfer protein
LVLAAVIAGLVVQMRHGGATEGTMLSASTMNIMELQIQAGKSLPVVATGDLV